MTIRRNTKRSGHRGITEAQILDTLGREGVADGERDGRQKAVVAATADDMTAYEPQQQNKKTQDKN
jgi:hypothetical protein